MSVTASCEAITQEWRTEAKQANSFSGPPGNNFNYDPLRAKPSVTVDSSAGPGPATKLQFMGQPSRAQVSTDMRPAVTVQALDACDQPAVATGNVDLALNPNPSDAALDNASQAFDANGLATFSALQVNKVGEGYQLVASADGLESSEQSEAFDVVTRLCTSSLLEPSVCQLSDGTVTVLTARPKGDATMTLDLEGVGPICAGYNSRGAVARIEPEDYAGTAGIEMTMRWSKSVAPGTGVSNFVLCMSEDGATYDVAPLCTKSGKIPTGKFCELKRNRNGVGELVITFLIAPQDPYVGLG